MFRIKNLWDHVITLVTISGPYSPSLLGGRGDIDRARVAKPRLLRLEAGRLDSVGG